MIGVNLLVKSWKEILFRIDNINPDVNEYLIKGFKI